MILSSTLFIIVLDNTILNVAVPTIIREFHTQVSSMQWVISGYSLVFASLLISFGRLGDIVGRRKMFFIGAALFAVGSLIASLSQSVVQLFIGESLIEGIGAAMMLPATLSILSATFQGRERGVAFAVWGSVAGGAGALGPWIGGILTTDYSWRWAFRVNVVIAPLAIIAGIFYVHESKDERAKGLDPAGVVAVTVGLLALVFGIIEAGALRLVEADRRPVDRRLEVAAPLGLDRAGVAGDRGRSCWRSFVRLELRRVAAGKPVVFDFTDLVHRGLPLRPDQHDRAGDGRVRRVLRAADLPAGRPAPHPRSRAAPGCCPRASWRSSAAASAASSAAGTDRSTSSPSGSRSRRSASGCTSPRSRPSTTFWSLLPALMLHGIGIGFATSQLTNVVLSDIPPQKAGSASGAAGMVRQVGTALGIALIGAIFVSQATSHVRHDLSKATDIPAAVREQVVKGVGDGIGGGAPAGAADTPVGRHDRSIVSTASPRRRGRRSRSRAWS